MPETTKERAVRVVELAQQIKTLAETPAEYGGEHAAAQSALASMGYELAELILAEVAA